MTTAGGRTGATRAVVRTPAPRLTYLVKQAELARHIERDKEHTAREDEILRQVEARNRLRRQAKGATGQWRAYRARAVLDTYAGRKYVSNSPLPLCHL